MLPEKVDANQRLRQTQAELGLAGAEKLPFLCECENVHCRVLMRLTADEYDAARSFADRCIVAVAHAHGSRVVLEGDGYAVVES